MFPDISPTIFRLYRRDFLGAHHLTWQGEACYLSDALLDLARRGGNLEAIAKAEFDRLDLPGTTRTYSSEELADLVNWVKAHG